jgi:hypothetical protein
MPTMFVMPVEYTESRSGTELGTLLTTVVRVVGRATGTTRADDAEEGWPSGAYRAYEPSDTDETDELGNTAEAATLGTTDAEEELLEEGGMGDNPRGGIEGGCGAGCGSQDAADPSNIQ